MSTAAPAIGAARLIEQLNEKASQYATQEAAMKTYAAQVAQAKESAGQGQQDQEPPKVQQIGADGQTLIRSADATSQAQANQTQSYSSMLDKIIAFLRDLAKKMASLFTRAFAAAPGLSIKKADQEPAKWLTKKGVWSEQELAQGILPDNKINAEIKKTISTAEMKEVIKETEQVIKKASETLAEKAATLKEEKQVVKEAKRQVAVIKDEVSMLESYENTQAAHKRRRR